jgi:transposase InsO family protein
VIRHSDRGSQYCSHDDQALLKQYGMTASMSRKGNCWECRNRKLLQQPEERTRASGAAYSADVGALFRRKPVHDSA